MKTKDRLSKYRSQLRHTYNRKFGDNLFNSPPRLPVRVRPHGIPEMPHVVLLCSRAKRLCKEEGHGTSREMHTVVSREFLCGLGLAGCAFSSTLRIFKYMLVQDVIRGSSVHH